MIPVKICGITSLNDARICIKSGVAALGFIFAESKRKISVANAQAIIRQLPPFVTKVGVFVNEDPLVIKEILMDCHLDLVQLHGDESPAVTEVLPWRILKAFKAGLQFSTAAWRNTPLRGVLVDSFTPTSSGGTGQTFDWSLFDQYRSLGFPLILAGGLNPANILEAISQTKPDAVDLSSGVEREPGVKDPEKIRELMNKIRTI